MYYKFLKFNIFVFYGSILLGPLNINIVSFKDSF